MLPVYTPISSILFTLMESLTKFNYVFWSTSECCLIQDILHQTYITQHQD